PLISGGEKVPANAWSYYQSGIFVAHVDAPHIRQLYAGTAQLTRARTPNVSSMGLGGSGYAPILIEWTYNAYYQIRVAYAPWLPPVDSGFQVELVAPVGWAVSRIPMGASAVSGGETWFSPALGSDGFNPAWTEQLKANGSARSSYGPFHLGSQRVYFEGDYTFIDENYEWAYDRFNHLL